MSEALTLHSFQELSRGGVRFAAVAPLAFGAGEENTFVGAFRRVLQVCGCDVPYWHLMAVCGAAFRLQIHCNSWRPISPDLLCGFELGEALLSAFGFTCEQHWVCGDARRTVPVRQQIIRGLDQGMPSMGLGLTGEPQYGVIVGYSQRNLLLALDYAMRGMPHTINENVVWCYILLARPHPPLSEAARVRQAFTLGHALMTRQRERRFHLGLDAYDYWYGTLTNPMHHQPLKDDWRTKERNDGNYLILVNLIDARAAAARFCQALQDDCPNMSGPLGELADLYRRMVDTLRPLIDKRIVRPNASISPAQPWTMHERRKQARVLMEVKALEEKTIPLLAQIMCAL